MSEGLALVISVDRPAFRLRAVDPTDQADLRRHADDAEVARFTSHRFPNPFTEADAARFIAQYLEGKNVFARAIDVDGAFVGALTVHVGEGTESHCGELGYWIGRAFWGRGIMRAAVGEFVPGAFEALGLERIAARVADGNAASMRILERNGFAKEGVQRRAIYKHGVLTDCHLYARLRDD